MISHQSQFKTLLKQLFEVPYTKEDHILQIYPRLPLLSSNGTCWQGIHLGYYNQPAHQTPEHSSKQYIISINVGQPATLKIQQNDEQSQELVGYGESRIYPASYPFKESWNRDIEFIELYLEPTLFAQIVHEWIDFDRVEILFHCKIHDPFLQQIGVLLKEELESATNSVNTQSSLVNTCLYAESLTTALVAHLLKHYSTEKQHFQEPQTGLPTSQLKVAVNYIREHLEHDLSLTEIAAITHLSPHYFATLFRQSTGETFLQYVTRCRIERAKVLLARRELSIADICQQVGFQDQNHFTKVFRRYTHLTPKVYRNKL